MKPKEKAVISAIVDASLKEKAIYIIQNEMGMTITDFIEGKLRELVKKK